MTSNKQGLICRTVCVPLLYVEKMWKVMFICLKIKYEEYQPWCWKWCCFLYISVNFSVWLYFCHVLISHPVVLNSYNMNYFIYAFGFSCKVDFNFSCKVCSLLFHMSCILCLFVFQFLIDNIRIFNFIENLIYVMNET